MDLFRPGPVVWIQELFGPGWEPAFQAVTVLGESWGFILATGLVYWIWGRRALWALLAVAAVEAVVKTALSTLVMIPRPTAEVVVKYEEVGAANSSFPSGHTSSATALWASMGPPERLRIGLGLAVGGAVALSRLYLGVHWVTDVVASVALGLAVAWAVRRVWPHLRSRLARVPFEAWAVLAVVGFVGTVAAALLLLDDALIRWRGAGSVAGLCLALPLEHHFVRHGGDGTSRARRGMLTAVGLVGLGLLAFAGARLATGPRAAGAVALAAQVWALVGAPLLVLGAGHGSRSSTEASATAG